MNTPYSLKNANTELDITKRKPSRCRIVFSVERICEIQRIEDKTFRTFYYICITHLSP